jgi:uncharacterized protein (DUF2236 family)
MVRLENTVQKTNMSRDYARQPRRAANPYREVRAAARRVQQQLARAEDWGYFGPGSAMWQLHREAVLGLGLGRAVLLQVAHPWVAQAVTEHSRYRTQPLERLVETVTAAELLIFGSRRQAEATAAMLHRMHSRVSGVLYEATGRWPAGTPYRANDPAALRWVLMALLDTTIRLYEDSFGQLPESTVRAYLADGARLGQLLGVPAPDVPRDRRALQAYLDGCIADGTVAVGSAGQDVVRALREVDVLPGLAWRTYSRLVLEVAIATLPGSLRQQYGPVLPAGPHPLLRMGTPLGRGMLRWLPGRLRVDPLAAVALKRAAWRN